MADEDDSTETKVGHYADSFMSNSSVRLVSQDWSTHPDYSPLKHTRFIPVRLALPFDNICLRFFPCNVRAG
jgi:hypothetical protein